MAFAFPTFRHPSLVTYGTGSIKSLGSTGDWANTVLFASGSTAVEAYLRQAWAKRGPDLASIRMLVKPPGEPTWEVVSETAELLRQGLPDRIVAVGGGSVLDWARLSWLAAVGVLDANGTVTDQWQDRRRRLELVLVPTTCGSGAEAAAIAVMTSAGRKVPVVSAALLADHVVLDSRFLSTVSDFTMACSLADACSHAVEAWMSIVPGRLPRQAAVSCLRLLLRSGPPYDRAATLMDAGFLGGVAAAHCSVGVVHAFAHSMSRHGLGHGHANALALAPAVRRLTVLPPAANLLEELGLGADALVERVDALIAPALDPQASARALVVLDTPRDREELVEAMSVDPCLRTCPLPTTRPDLEAFLDDVRDGMAKRC